MCLYFKHSNNNVSVSKQRVCAPLCHTHTEWAYGMATPHSGRWRVHSTKNNVYKYFRFILSNVWCILFSVANHASVLSVIYVIIKSVLAKANTIPFRLRIIEYTRDAAFFN